MNKIPLPIEISELVPQPGVDLTREQFLANYTVFRISDGEFVHRMHVSDDFREMEPRWQELLRHDFREAKRASAAAALVRRLSDENPDS